MTEERKAKGLDLMIKTLNLTWSDVYEKSNRLEKLVPYCPEKLQEEILTVIGFLLLSKDKIETLVKKLEEVK